MALDKITTKNYSKGIKVTAPIFATVYNEAVDQINTNTEAIADIVADVNAGTVLTLTESSTPGATHTINTAAGKCLIAHGSTAGLATLTVTITNSLATADSIVVASIGDYGGNGTPLIKEITPAAGSIVIEIYNAHASTALSANFDLVFAILA